MLVVDVNSQPSMKHFDYSICIAMVVYRATVVFWPDFQDIWDAWRIPTISSESYTQVGFLWIGFTEFTCLFCKLFVQYSILTLNAVSYGITQFVLFQPGREIEGHTFLYNIVIELSTGGWKASGECVIVAV